MLPHFPVSKRFLPYPEYMPLISFLIGYFGFVLQTASWWYTSESIYQVWDHLLLAGSQQAKSILQVKGRELNLWFTVELLYKNRFDNNSCL